MIHRQKGKNKLLDDEQLKKKKKLVGAGDNADRWSTGVKGGGLYYPH